MLAAGLGQGQAFEFDNEITAWAAAH